MVLTNKHWNLGVKLINSLLVYDIDISWFTTVFYTSALLYRISFSWQNLGVSEREHRDTPTIKRKDFYINFSLDPGFLHVFLENQRYPLVN